MTVTSIGKLLTANDVGKTGAHQAGAHIPKDPEILAFFPALDSDVLNPRVSIQFIDELTGEPWEFAFIHYNNKKFGGTRNEYRLTRMTPWMREVGAAVGDELILTRDDRMRYRIECRKQGPTATRIVLTETWVTIRA
jgi:hypothetical protein